MIDLPPDRLPIPEAKYPYAVRLLVSWPRCVKHRGKTYAFTGKEGLEIQSGLPSAEYSHHTRGQECRLWLHIDGEINPD